MKRVSIIISFILLSLGAKGQDTLYVNERTTLHLQCLSDIVYCDLGSNNIIAAVAPNVPSLLRIKASTVFTDETTLSVMTEDDVFTTYIVKYTNKLKRYIVKQGGESSYIDDIGDANNQNEELIVKINNEKPVLNHIFNSTLKLDFNVNSIYIANNKVYITISVDNKSSISYKADVTFIVSDIRGNRSAAQDIILLPIERYGRIEADGGHSATATFAFDKLAISDNKQIKINFFEIEGYRNISLRIDSKDIAKSKPYSL